MALTYKQRIAAFEGKVGDSVLVHCKVKSRAGGWDNTWIPEMNECVGKIGTIVNLDGVRGIQVRFDKEVYKFPIQALQITNTELVLTSEEVIKWTRHTDICSSWKNEIARVYDVYKADTHTIDKEWLTNAFENAPTDELKSELLKRFPNTLSEYNYIKYDSVADDDGETLFNEFSEFVNSWFSAEFLNKVGRDLGTQQRTALMLDTLIAAFDN
jgi:hypothetical protein